MTLETPPRDPNPPQDQVSCNFTTPCKLEDITMCAPDSNVRLRSSVHKETNCLPGTRPEVHYLPAKCSHQIRRSSTEVSSPGRGINACMSKRSKADPNGMDLITTRMFLLVCLRHRCDPLMLFQIKASHAFAIGLAGIPLLGFQRDSREKRWHPSHRTPPSEVLLWPQSRLPAFKSACLSSHTY